MGVDLTLLPIEHDEGRWGFSHSVLGCDRSTALHDAVQRLPTRDVPEKFMTYLSRGRNGDSCYGETRETPYGEALRAVTVKHLVALAAMPAVQGTPRNRAVWAYLAQLDPEMKIALYWH